jgi:exosortase H (IPTLxxWG-CTERM-specific)
VLKQLNLRFACILTLYLGVVLLTDRDEVLGPILAPLTLFTADATYFLLSWLGVDAVREGNVIAHAQGFAYQIYYSCTGFILMLSLAVSILAYPSRLTEKTVGIALGVPILFVLNQVRLVHLFYVGIFDAEQFEYVHHVLWEYLMILIVASLWLSWASWSELRVWNARPRAFTSSAAV